LPVSADRLAVLSHELRSSVAALVAIAEVYAESDSTRRLRLLELARAASRNIERLVSDATVASVRLERLDAGLIARDAAEAAAVGDMPVCAIVEEALPFVDADPLRLRQALDNLIGNALGHSPAGAEVVVRARVEGGRVLLSVTDRGEGMPESELDRVFEPGVRLTGDRPGSGLGLAIVRAIAEAHGGSIAVQSAPGQGATFTLALPVSGAQA
jgi:signal transduction histidine kinase